MCNLGPRITRAAQYVESKKALDADGLGAELTRLNGMSGKKMAPKQLGWLNKRIKLLQKLKDEL